METKDLERLIQAACSGSRNKPLNGNYYVMTTEDMHRFVNILRAYDKNNSVELYSGLNYE